MNLYKFIKNILDKNFSNKISSIEKLNNIGLEILLSELISKSWKKDPNLDFILKEKDLPVGDYATLVGSLLKHVRKVATRLDIPLFIPKIEITTAPTPKTAKEL